MTALPDVSGVPHPATWPFYPHRWFGRFVVRRRFSVVEHGVEHSRALPQWGGRADIVYGAPYRTERRPRPRIRLLVDLNTLDLRVHMLVALDAARTLTGRSLPGPLPPGRAEADPSTSVTPGANPGGTP